MAGGGFPPLPPPFPIIVPVQTTKTPTALPHPLFISMAGARAGAARPRRRGAERAGTDDPPAIADHLGGKFDLRHGASSWTGCDLEAADVDDQLIIGGKAFHRPGDGADICRVLETLDYPRLEHFR